MIAFLTENAGTIIVLSILILVIVLIFTKLIRDKKNGKCMCSCGCSGCPSQGSCNGNKSQ